MINFILGFITCAILIVGFVIYACCAENKEANAYYKKCEGDFRERCPL